MSRLITDIIDLEDGNRDLAFRVEVKYFESEDGTVELKSAKPLSGYVVMPVITHREMRNRGKDQKEEFEFKIPDCPAFASRFHADYEDDICCVIEEQIAARIETCGRW